MIREMARHRNSMRALGEIGCPTWNRTKIYGFRVRRATVALQGKKVAWPDHPKAIEPRFIGVALSRCYQHRRWRGTESRDHFLGRIGMKSTRVGVFCIHRRKCHLAGAFAPSSWMVWQDLRMKREDAAMGWYWTPWITSWLLVETIRLPALPRSGPLYKRGAYAARPSRKVWAHRELHPGLAD